MANKNIREIIEQTNDSLFGTTEQLDKIETGVQNIKEEVTDLSDKAKDAESGLKKMTEALDVEASINRLVELNRQMDAVEEAYKAGKISADDYRKSLSKLEVEADGLSKALLRQGEDVDSLVESAKAAKRENESLAASIKASNSSVQEYEGSFEKVGATANTSLSLIAAAIKDTNPGLSTMIGGVQKLIPNLTELGNAAKKTGSLMKAMTSSAGILTLITLVTTLITDFDNIAETVGISTEAIDNFKSRAGDAIQKVTGFVVGLGKAIGTWLVTPYKTIAASLSKIVKGDLKGAWDEIKDGFKTQFSKETYVSAFESGKEAGSNWVAGIRARKKNVEEAASESGKAAGESFADSLLKSAEAALAANERKLNERMSLLASQAKEILADIDEETKELSDDIDAYTKSVCDGILAEMMAPIEAAKTQEEAEKKMHEIRMERNKAFMESSTKLFDSIASSLGDNIKSELEAGKITESQYKKRMAVVKAFQIASIVGEAASGIQSIWRAYAMEKVANAETAAATGPAAAVTLAALNTKSLVSAIAQTGTIVATSAAGIASLNSGSLSSASSSISSAATPSVSATPTVSQTYTLNQDYSGQLSSLESSFKSQQVVLVVDDVTKVQDTSTRVQTQASF